MDENLDFSLDREPAAEQPSVTPKKNVLPIALIIGSVCTVLLFCGIVLSMFFAKSPFEKTVKAVFPSTELFGELIAEGGKLTVEGELANDLLDRNLKESVCFSAESVFSLDSTLFKLTAGAKDDRIDLSVLADKEGVQVFSDRLLRGDGYGISFDGLMEAIDASPFAPDSGTNYALSREMYDAIKEYAELLEEEPQTFEQTALVLAKASDAMLKKAQIYKKRETVSLVDGDTKAKVYSYTFGAESFDAFIDVLSDEWENNEAFRKEIESADIDGQIIPFIEKTLKELKMREDSIPREESPFKDLEVTCKYAVKGGYLVYADCLITDSSYKKENSVFAAIKFTDNPKKDPSYDIAFSVTQGEITHPRYAFTYRKSDDGKKEEWSYYDTLSGPEYTATAEYGEDGAFALTVKHEIDVDVTDRCELFTLWQFDLNGTLHKDDDTFDLSVDEMKYTDQDGNTQFHMSDSSFAICLESGKPSIERRKNEINLLGMSVAELNELGTAVEEALIGALDSIGNKLGTELVHDTYMPNALAQVKVESHLCDYAYDRTNGHLFFAYDCGTSGEIWMYEAQTMELLDKLILDDPVLAIDADNGYLVFVYGITGQQSAYVHSSQTLEHITTVDYAKNNAHHSEWDRPGDVAVDGDKLIYISGDQHVFVYFTDLKTGETTRSVSTAYQPKLTLDRNRHVVALLENSSSACDLLFFSTVSGELIERVDRFGFNAQYLDGPAHYDGKYFWATSNEWYNTDGAFGTLENALGFDTQGTLAQIVYRDENLVVTLEIDETGSACTAFYRPDGTFCDSVPELYTWMQPTDGNRYLAAYQDGNKTVFAYCELVESKTIG